MDSWSTLKVFSGATPNISAISSAVGGFLLPFGILGTSIRLGQLTPRSTQAVQQAATRCSLDFSTAFLNGFSQRTFPVYLKITVASTAHLIIKFNRLRLTVEC